jgi:hypothetical protein
VGGHTAQRGRSGACPPRKRPEMGYRGRAPHLKSAPAIGCATRRWSVFSPNGAGRKKKSLVSARSLFAKVFSHRLSYIISLLGRQLSESSGTFYSERGVAPSATASDIFVISTDH